VIRTPSLPLNNHDGTFREEGLLRGVALSEDGDEQAGMGIGIGDYNLDGHLDIFADDACVFYQGDAKGNFEDVSRQSRIGVETRYVSWGAGLVDLDAGSGDRRFSNLPTSHLTLALQQGSRRPRPACPASWDSTNVS